jgi:hypothetical protein
MTEGKEDYLFIKDTKEDPKPSEKNRDLARHLQGGGLKLDILKIERHEEKPKTGWKITYRVPG